MLSLKQCPINFDGRKSFRQCLPKIPKVSEDWRSSLATRSVAGMLALVSTVFSWLARRVRSRAELELELIALCHLIGPAPVELLEPAFTHYEHVAQGPRRSRAAVGPSAFVVHRSAVMGLALPGVAALPRGDGAAGHRDSVNEAFGSTRVGGAGPGKER